MVGQVDLSRAQPPRLTHWTMPAALELTSAVEGLRQQLWGDALLPSDPQWDQALKLWAKPVKSINPAVVVRPRGVDDIQKALRFAADYSLDVSVKSGGHNPAGLALVEGGLVLDLSNMRGVYVDPKAKIAVAEGGAQLGDIDRASAVYQLAAPLGHAPTTGLGLVLNGGMGVLKTIFGPTAQHIVAAVVVLADGRVVHVTSETEPELLWGLQGAGSALGVVASVTLRLHDVSTAYAGILGFPDDPQHNNMKAIARFMASKGRLEPWYSNNLVQGVTPDGHAMIFVMLAYLGPKSEAEKAAFIAPLRELGPVMDTVGQATYADMQNFFLPLVRSAPPHHEYWTSGQYPATQFSEELLDTWCSLVDEMPQCTKQLSILLFDMWRGPAGLNSGFDLEEGPDTGPHGLLRAGAEFGWLADLAYLDGADEPEVKAFARKWKTAMAQFGETDVYSNTTSEGATENATESQLSARVGGAEKLARLRALKSKVDPGNMFRSHPFKGLVNV